MKIVPQLARKCLHQLRSVRRCLTTLYLKAKGVEVSWSAWVHPDTVFELSGGRIFVGPNTYIDKGVILRAFGGSIIIGSDCSVNAYSLLSGGGGLVIGNAVRIASHTVIVASNHIFEDASKLIKDQGLSQKGIKIESDVWIGVGVRVLDGVTIARGSVVAAGAVVTKSTDSFSVVAGVPAHKIGARNQATEVDCSS